MFVFVVAITLSLYANIEVIRAAPGTVVFNEVNWAGSKSSTSDEWLELTNPGDTAVDLTNWSIWSTASEPKQLVVIPSGIITPGKTFLIANNGPDYQFSLGTSTLAVVPDFVDSSVSLSNTALRLELRDAAGQVVDMVGDAGKPFFGSTEPIASMERLLPTIGSGDLAASWRTTTGHDHLDQDAGQQGTPTPSGSALQQGSPPPTTKPSKPNATSSESSATTTSLQAVVQGQVTGIVQVQGTISVTEQSYLSRTAVLSDGLWSVELSLPVTSSLQLEQGARITIIATVSRGSTPKLLLASDVDVIGREHSQNVNLLQLADIDHPALFQLLHMRGVAHPGRGVLELSANGYTFHVTRKQGVSLPTIQDQDDLQLTGLVVSLDPLTVRILSNDSVTVATTTDTNSVSGGDLSGEAADTTDSLTNQTTDAIDATLRVGDANSLGLDAAIPLEAVAQAEVAGDSSLQSTVLGARNSRKASPLESISWYTAIVSGCAILTLLGDSLWIRLKYKQQQ